MKNTRLKWKQWVLISTVLALAALIAAGNALAATNQAVDGGGSVTLTASPQVSITSTQLALVKAVYDATTGTCLASSDSDAACGGGTSASVPTGTRLTFVIYVANTAGVTASNVRFVDNIRDVTAGADYFEFVATTYGAASGIKWATIPVAGADKTTIRAAAIGGTALTNALDGDTGTNEYAGIDTGASPDILYVGGAPGLAPANNDQVDITAGNIFAITFDVIKRD